MDLESILRLQDIRAPTPSQWARRNAQLLLQTSLPELEHPDQLIAIGIELFIQRKFSAAKPHFERALKLAPNNLRAAFYLACCLVELNEEILRAIEILDKSIRSFPKNKDLIEIIILAYKKARILISKYLELKNLVAEEPVNKIAQAKLERIKKVLTRSDRQSETLTIKAHLDRLDETEITSEDLFALSLLFKDRLEYSFAIEAMHLYLHHNPDYPPAFVFLGDFHDQIGETENALFNYRLAITYGIAGEFHKFCNRRILALEKG